MLRYSDFPDRMGALTLAGDLTVPAAGMVPHFSGPGPPKLRLGPSL